MAETVSPTKPQRGNLLWIVRLFDDGRSFGPFESVEDAQIWCQKHDVEHAFIILLESP